MFEGIAVDVVFVNDKWCVQFPVYFSGILVSSLVVAPVVALDAVVPRVSRAGPRTGELQVQRRRIVVDEVVLVNCAPALATFNSHAEAGVVNYHISNYDVLGRVILADTELIFAEVVFHDQVVFTFE